MRVSQLALDLITQRIVGDVGETLSGAGRSLLMCEDTAFSFNRYRLDVAINRYTRSSIGTNFRFSGPV